MLSSKVFICLALFVAVSFSKVITIKNSQSAAIEVSVDGLEYTVASKALVILNQADGWSGSISAVPVDAEVNEGPRTKVELSLGATEDKYSVSLIDGFNFPAKVIPNGSTNCTSAICAANILKLCPIANQVTNSTDTVVACKNSPIVMSKVCPLAVVDDLTSALNVQTCNSAISYLILF